MKKILVILVMLFILFTFGCQQQSNEVIEEDLVNNIEKTNITEPENLKSPEISVVNATNVLVDVVIDTTKEFEVHGSNFKFEPNELVVNKGDTVRVTFISNSGFHDFVIDEFEVKTDKYNGGGSETIEFVADQTGEFKFYCSVGSHRANGMEGTLIVQ